MKRLMIVLTLVASALFGNVVDDLIAARKLELADAYWLAGQRYLELDKTEIGRQMQERARQLVPGYLPPDQRPQNDGTLAVTPSPDTVVVPAIDPEELARRSAQGERIVRYQFSKLVRGFLSEDVDTLVSTFAPELKGPGIETGITRAEVRRRAADLFSSQEADKLTPEMLLDMASIRLAAVEGTDSDFILTVNTVADAPEFLTSRAWWGPSVSFYFIRENNLWVIAGISN